MEMDGWRSVKFETLVDRIYDFYGVCHNRFKLDDTVYEALEDEMDGWRSMLSCVVVRPWEGEDTFFPMPIARVRLVKVPNDAGFANDADFDGYHLVDIEDDHLWLRFGTERYDDYYPCFAFNYHPKEQRENDIENVEQAEPTEPDAMGPTIKVIINFPFSDMALDGDDTAMISDEDMISRAERWLGLEAGSLSRHEVRRTETGHVVITPVPVFGSTQ